MSMTRQGQHSIQARRRGVKGPSMRDLDELRALWGTMPVTQIARQLGISRRTAYRWYEKTSSVSHLRTSVSHFGYSVESLAAALGVSAQRVLRWVKLGWLARKPASPAAEDEDSDGEGEACDFSDTGVWRLWVQHPHEVFPNGATPEQVVWLAGMRRTTGRQGKVKAS